MMQTISSERAEYIREGRNGFQLLTRSCSSKCVPLAGSFDKGHRHYVSLSSMLDKENNHSSAISHSSSASQHRLDECSNEIDAPHTNALSRQQKTLTNIGLEFELDDYDLGNDNNMCYDNFLPNDFDCGRTSPSSSIDEDYDDQVYKMDELESCTSRIKCQQLYGRPRKVRFALRLVSEVRYRPRTTNDEWRECYYSAHELQNNMINHNREQRRNCTIIAEEEDLKFD